MSRRLPGLLLTCGCLAPVACTPSRYERPSVDTTYRPPRTLESVLPGESLPDPGAGAQPPFAPAAATQGPVTLDAVIASVTSRYPPYLSTLLERDLASGRLTQAMGGFDTTLGAKVGGTLQGYYEATTAEGMLEQPLATGDTVYGGYRITDGFLPDYYDPRTQDDGQLVFGVRVPLLRGRATDARRAAVRKAEIGVELADPVIAGARIAYVREASVAFYNWEAAGRKLSIARELLRLAEDRQGGLQRAVEREFLPPIDLVDNERLITQRRVLVARAERAFQAAALAMSLFYRAEDDRPIVAGEARLPPAPEAGPALPADSAETAVARAMRQRPEFLRVQLQIDEAETDLELARNDRLPGLDLLVETQSSFGEGPYTDREDFGLFVGGKIDLPLQRRGALGRMQIANARLSQLRIEQGFLAERILNQVLDARSGLQNALAQLDATARNVDLARQLVAAEQRAFDLGRSDLLRIQLREAQLADAQVLAVDARLAFERALVDYQAVLGEQAAAATP